MGNPKQKWTPEEEAALRAGIDKHGAGKWRTIQKDPEFAVVLATRSNVDLKDKWRNMSVGLTGQGSRERQHKVLKLGRQRGSEDCASLSGEAFVEVTQGASSMVISADSQDRTSLDNSFVDIIINSIIDMNESNGSSTTEIASFIEARYPVPLNFKRLLSSKLRDMVNQGSLLKIKQSYKVNPMDPKVLQVCSDRKIQRKDDMMLRKTQLMQETLKKKGRYENGLTKFGSQEAARAAAMAIADAEAAAAACEIAAKEAEDAESEAEAAIVAMELAALAAQNYRKATGASIQIEDIVIVV